MNNKQLLMVFTKNPELGKCKTRLAATIGNEAALKVYEQLLDHTVYFSSKVNAEKYVYYSKDIQSNDRWDESIFKKRTQVEGNLGVKMASAFKENFDAGFQKIIIIGSDCAEINEEDIHNAFEALDKSEVVIGPAIDGGYYLLGMKTFIPSLFQDKSWSTPDLINETISTLKKQQISFSLLKEKSDIDYEEDLERENFVTFSW
ncbi:MAG: TIGR04282 family arsenosugar biosynthesis glycosyltransferase [Brumimicrobium sp.]